MPPRSLLELHALNFLILSPVAVLSIFSSCNFSLASLYTQDARDYVVRKPKMRGTIFHLHINTALTFQIPEHRLVTYIEGFRSNRVHRSILCLSVSEWDLRKLIRFLETLGNSTSYILSDEKVQTKCVFLSIPSTKTHAFIHFFCKVLGGLILTKSLTTVIGTNTFALFDLCD